MPYSDLLKNIWNFIYDPQTDLIEKIEQFFHKADIPQHEKAKIRIIPKELSH
ncbi:Uncharacterised protein [Legionella donaldsonii]|uniref:Uncharacterized protein n=1 Tax=Legionella donaldsonii TaxID=45060 RepID=A0A378JBU9_9GAMM|nr:hypothetical protein [Legionella donaldsonii]STX44816.1 Uncharacterised protein [Legionella donaldsonii]